MRTLITFTVIVVCMLIIACQPTSTSTETAVVEEVTKSGPNTKDTISEDKFNKWKNAWDRNQRAWMDTSKITYFNLPIVDLSEVVDENATGSRFYLGLEGNKGKGFGAKLMLVGTRQNGEDMIDYDNGLYVYDFSTVCPPFCDDGE